MTNAENSELFERETSRTQTPLYLNSSPRSAPLRLKPRDGKSSGLVGIDIAQEMRALEALHANVTAHNEDLDDPELMLLLAEGETNLLELIDRMLELDLDDDAFIDALKQARDTMAVRLHRLQERRRSRRSILEQALVLLERKSLERPTGTLSLSERAPALVVEEEAAIPARFFDLKPVLNRQRAKAALDGGETVPGATLSNGSITLTVRRR